MGKFTVLQRIFTLFLLCLVLLGGFSPAEARRKVYSVPQAIVLTSDKDEIVRRVSLFMDSIGFYLIDESPSILTFETESRTPTFGEGLAMYFGGLSPDAAASGMVTVRSKWTLIKDGDAGYIVTARLFKTWNAERSYNRDVLDISKSKDWDQTAGDFLRTMAESFAPKPDVVTTPASEQTAEPTQEGPEVEQIDVQDSPVNHDNRTL